MTAKVARVMTGFARSLTLVVIGLWCGPLQSADSVHATQKMIEFDRIDIPADQPAAWPKNIVDFDEIPRDELISLMEKVNSRHHGPRSAWLKSAHYEATLVNDTLRGGLMTASVHRLNRQNSLVELGPFSFALRELKWQDRAAIWGSSADGRVWVVADGRSDELLGEWSSRGRAIPGGIDANLANPLWQ